MSAKGGSDGGGDSAGGGSSPSGGGSAAGGGSAGNILNTVLHQLFPFWFHFLINLPGTNWFIGFCGQRDFSITRLYLLWIEKTPSGDFKGEQPNVGNEIHHVDPSTSQWGLSDNLSKNPKKEPGIHYHYRNFYQGLPIIVVPILSMMNHFILLTDQYIYFFRINSQNKLEVIHRIEASEAEGVLYKSCAISENGQNMVIHHKCGFSIFKISMSFGQFEVSLLKNVVLPQPSRAFPFMYFLGDVNQVEMSGSGVVVVYESSHFSNGAEPVIKILLQNEGSIHRFPLRGIKEIPSGQPIKSVKLCQISRTKIRVILGSIDFVVLLILDLGREVSLCFGAILNLGFEIQQICPCSVNPTHFFVAGKKKERSGEILLGYEKCRIKPTLIEFAIQGDALVKIDEQSFDKGGVSDCSYLTSSGGIVIASFIGKDYRARESVIGETRKVESSVPPSLSRSTLNGAPIQLEPSGVFTVLPGGEIVASNADNGLTLFGPDCKPIASTDSKDAHKSPITSVFLLEVDGKTFLLSYSHSDCSIKIWSIQKRGETVHIRIVATISTADLVPKKGVKFLALHGKTLMIVTNKDKILRFHVEIIGGIRADIRPIPGPVVQIPSGQICQGIAAISPTHAIIHVAATSGIRECYLVLVSFAEDTPEIFKLIGTRETGKSPAVLIPNGFAVSAVVSTTVCSTALAPDGVSFSFTPKDFDKRKKLCDATILAIVPCEDGGFICITANGFLIQFVYDAQQKPVFKKKIAVLECALTPKCRLQVSGNTVMVCQPRDDGSFELRTFQF